LSVFQVGPTPAYWPGMTVPVGCLAMALCAASALTLCPQVAQAQGADSLPTLDESPPVTAPEALPPPPPPSTVVLSTPSKKGTRLSAGPIRAQRRLALLGEVGWNGIAGFGPILTFHLHPHFSLDLGAGLSLLGWKTGLRGRYNLLTGPVTPFVGVGVMTAGGFGDAPILINDNDPDPMREKVNVKILPSAWLQTVGGVDWTAPGGFTLVGAVGWANLLSHDPVQVTSGTPNAEERQAFDIVWRSGVVITTTIGYSFR